MPPDGRDRPPGRPAVDHKGARPNPRVADSTGDGEVYFEFIPSGAYVKVTAIDAATGTEVSIVGAATASRQALERTALAKLKFVLNRRA